MKRLFLILLLIICTGSVYGFTTKIAYVSLDLINTSSNENYNGSYAVNSSIWSASSGGNLWYSQLNNSYEIVNGTYGLIMTGDFSSVDWWADFWIEAIIGADVQTPRLEVVPVPQAIVSINATYADYLDAYDSADFILTTDEGNLNVNSSDYLDDYDSYAFQRRLNNCSAGYSIREVLWNGSVVCEEDSTGTDTNADTECAGDENYYSGEGNCIDVNATINALEIDTYNTTADIIGVINTSQVTVECQYINFSGTIGSASICDG